MQDLQQQTFLNYIGGAWVPCASGKTAPNRNPADTREVVGHFQMSAAEDGERAVAAAQAAFDAWKATSITKRAGILNRAADWLESRADQIGNELMREEGKAANLARDEVVRSAQTLRFYAAEGQSLAGETFVNDDPDMVVYTQREPLGVVTVISPWNFPISIPARKIAPALITGNTVVFKPSSDAPLSGLRLAEALIEAGLPAGVLNFITGPAGAVGEAITRNKAVRAVSFTGSTQAGEQIHRAVDMSTRTQMELGGKNPLIVMADADLDRAVDLVIKGGFSLSGQACTGTSRVLVDAPVKAAFTEKLLARVARLTVGNSATGSHDLGPLATARQLDTVLGYLDIGKQEARLLCGGEQLKDGDFAHGYYVTPAVFDDVARDARIAREEIFGPVIALIEVQGYDDAIACANDTEYGLAAAIATTNAQYAHRFARDIQAGTVKINRTTTGNLINAPFGGLKRSSTSTFRESGRIGLEFYTQIKTVYRAG
ncbi:aldehyde dehydrogenase family protein [Bordetella genomosp. 5]|uniref:aldehyde dehydrogenase family protein n=1 Tax=Bordetella genomosp. 5 TaxID=1395608 RepID=UPI000B9E244C|nr:aldehyde dehydrogenase family protein [Bordetella genomosp. 5]OZI47360.1 aldehyde dehydrogenase family protein [Bordetella genomosp. 5]